MSIFLHLTGLLSNNPKKWLSGPIKHSIHHKAEFVMLSVVLNSDDSLQKQQKIRTIRKKNRSYPDRSMNCTTSGVNFDPDGPY